MFILRLNIQNKVPYKAEVTSVAYKKLHAAHVALSCAVMCEVVVCSTCPGPCQELGGKGGTIQREFHVAF